MKNGEKKGREKKWLIQRNLISTDWRFNYIEWIWYATWMKNDDWWLFRKYSTLLENNIAKWFQRKINGFLFHMRILSNWMFLIAGLFINLFVFLFISFETWIIVHWISESWEDKKNTGKASKYATNSRKREI